MANPKRNTQEKANQLISNWQSGNVSRPSNTYEYDDLKTTRSRADNLINSWRSSSGFRDSTQNRARDLATQTAIAQHRQKYASLTPAQTTQSAPKANVIDNPNQATMQMRAEEKRYANDPRALYTRLRKEENLANIAAANEAIRKITTSGYNKSDLEYSIQDELENIQKGYTIEERIAANKARQADREKVDGYARSLGRARDQMTADNLMYDRQVANIEKYGGLERESDWDNVLSGYEGIAASRAELTAMDDAQRSFNYLNSNGKFTDYDPDTGEYITATGERVREPEKAANLNELEIFRAASPEEIDQSYDEVNKLVNSTSGDKVATWGQIVQKGKLNHWEQMDETEYKMYAYLWEKEGKESADKFLEDMSSEFGQRYRDQVQREIEDLPILSQILVDLGMSPYRMIGGIMGTIDNAINIVQGNDIQPYNAAHELSDIAHMPTGIIAKELNEATNNWNIFGFGIGELYSSLISGWDSRIGVNWFGEGYTKIMALGAANQAMTESYNKGASVDQVLMTGLFSGIAEALFERVSIENIVKDDAAGRAKTVGDALKRIFKQNGIEASEEVFTDLANMYTDMVVMGSQSEFQKDVDENGLGSAIASRINQLYNSAAGGFFSGVPSAGLGSAVQLADYNINATRTGAQNYLEGNIAPAMEYANAEGSPVTDKTRELAKEVAERFGKTDTSKATEDYNPFSKLAKQAIKASDDMLTRRDLNKAGKFIDSLATDVGVDAFNAEIKADLEGTEYDEQIPDILRKVAEGEGLTQKEKQIYKNAGGDEYFDKYVTPEFIKRVNEKTKNRLEGVAGKGKANRVQAAVTAKAEADAKERVNSENVTVLDETGETVEIKGMADPDGDIAMVELEDGRVVPESQISYANEDDAVMYGVLSTFRLSGNQANMVVNAVKESGINTITAMNNLTLAYDYGVMGRSVDTLKNLVLPENVRNAMYEQGRAYALQSDQELQDQANKLRVKNGNVQTLQNVKGVIAEANIDPERLSDRQRLAYEEANALAEATNYNIHVFMSEIKNGRITAMVDDQIKYNPSNGWYNRGRNDIYIDLNAGKNLEGLGAYTLFHELGHATRERSPKKWRALADLVTQEIDARAERGEVAHNIETLTALKFDEYQESRANGEESYEGRTDEELRDMAYEDVICDALSSFGGDKETFAAIMRELEQNNKTLFDHIKDFFEAFLKKLDTLLEKFKGTKTSTRAGEAIRTSAIRDQIRDLYVAAFVDANKNLGEAIAMSETEEQGYVDMHGADALQQRRFAEKHLELINKNFDPNKSTLDLQTITDRYNALLDIWDKVGVRLNSAFLDAWNNKDYKDRAFTVFKAQTGYKYNEELSSMCKKGIPLFDAIDTIVEKGIKSELKSKNIGKREKQILYDILKDKSFEIPCAICYVEQARQREGIIIDAFLEGKEEVNKKGERTKLKLGWNQVLDQVEAKMKDLGVKYSFPQVDRSIATDKYSPAELNMDQKTQDAFYEALRLVTNEEITRYNAEEKPKKPKALLQNSNPSTIATTFKGTLTENYSIFKVLFQNPTSRFRIADDLLYSSKTTENLARLHNALYGLFNKQSGVNGYKTKQGAVVYAGDLLGKKWSPLTLRKEGGLRNQSNSDFMMFTLLDMAQEYIDATVKGFTIQTYSKVPAMLKIFGLTGVKYNASLIPSVREIRNSDGSIDLEATRMNAGLDENGNLIWDDLEGINHDEAFMLASDPEYSKNIGGIAIGYSDKHIIRLLDDTRVGQIIGFHDKTDDPSKRYRGARYAKNYNGLNEATRTKADGSVETKHVGFNQFVIKAEKMFKKSGDTFTGTTTFEGKTYTADDIPMLAADLYKAFCKEKGYNPAYNIEGIVDHPNYYKLLADFSLKNSEGHYAPQNAVKFQIPDSVPYLENGIQKMMPTSEYIFKELQKEMATRDALAEALSDTSEDGIIPRFVKAVNADIRNESRETPLTKADYARYMELAKDPVANKDELKLLVERKAWNAGYRVNMWHGTRNGRFNVFDTFRNANNIGSHFGSEEAATGFAEGEYGGFRGTDPYVFNVVLKANNPYETYDWFADAESWAAMVAVELAEEINTPDAQKIIDRIRDVMPSEIQEMMDDPDLGDEEFVYDDYRDNPEEYDRIANILYGGIRDLVKLAGYDSIIYQNDLEDDGRYDYIALDPEQIKDAALVTYDDNGNIIPLEQRFNPTQEDIRYESRGASLTQADYDQYMELAKNPEKNEPKLMMLVKRAAIAAGAYKKGGKPLELYHGTHSQFNSFDIEKTKLGLFGYGHYFATDINDTEDYNGITTGTNGHTLTTYLISNKVATNRSHMIDADMLEEFCEEYDIDSFMVDSETNSEFDDSNDAKIIQSLAQVFEEYGEKYDSWNGKTASTFTEAISKFFGYDAMEVFIEKGRSYYVVFDNTKIKSADPVTYDDKGNTIPLNERFNTDTSDIRYESRDSEGNKLSKDQQEYFKDSKIRDKNGNLMVVYHGSPYGDFYEFDNRQTYADGLSIANWFSPSKELTQKFADLTTRWGNDASNRAFYVNITNPLIIDAKGAGWNNIELPDDLRNKGINKNRYGEWNTASTEQIASYAKANGYDGVIFNNVMEADAEDGIVTTSIATFDSNQAKLTDNQSPTENPDIRYESRDSEGNRLTQAQADYFKDSKARDENGNLVRLYHGTGYAGFTRFYEFKGKYGGGIFMTNDIDTARSYANGSEAEFDPAKALNPDEFAAAVEFVTEGKTEFYQENDYYVIKDMNVEPVYFDNIEEAWRYFVDEYTSQINHAGGTQIEATYSLYANIKNPLVVDGNGGVWNNLSPDGEQAYVDYAYVKDSSDGKWTISYREEPYGSKNWKWIDVTLDREGVDKFFGKKNAAELLLRGYIEEVYRPTGGLDDALVTTDHWVEYASDNGYDGVIFKNIWDGGFGTADVYVALKANQVKSVNNLNPTEDPDIRYESRSSNNTLAERNDTAVFVHNTKNANYINMILDGRKTVETRTQRTLNAYIGKKVYLTDGKYVYGTVVFGEPYQISAEDFHKAEFQKLHRVPVGDDYDIKDASYKWAYPITEYERFPRRIKMSDTTDYLGTRQARQAKFDRSTIINKLTMREISPKAYRLLDMLREGKYVSLDTINSLPEMQDGYIEKARIAKQIVSDNSWYTGDPEKFSTDIIDTPERDALREQIIQERLNSGSLAGFDEDGKEVYTGDVIKGHRLDIVTGLPASGKSSSIVNPLSQFYKSQVIDSDIVKEMLPEFNGGWGAGIVHEESSMINDILLARTLTTGNNIVLPVVGGKEKSVNRRIAAALEAGYQVYIHYNDLNPNKSMGRLINRFFNDGRFIDPIVIAGAGSPSNVFDTIKGRSDISGYTKWNCDVEFGQRPTLEDGTPNVSEYAEYSRQWRRERVESSRSRNKTLEGGREISSEVNDIRHEGRIFRGFTNAEIETVNRQAKHEVNRSNNYLSPIDKWLYNDSGNAPLFALYSTEYPEEPTIMYASKGARAKVDKDFITQRKGDYESHKTDGQADYSYKGTEGSRSKFDENTADSRRTLVGRTDRGDAGLASSSSRINVSRDLLNCLENIDKKRQAYSLNESRGNFDPRTALTGALETIAQTDAERQVLQRYQTQIESLNEMQTEAKALGKQLHDLIFSKHGENYKAEFNRLNAKKKELEQKINAMDKKLMNLEATAPFKAVVDREKARAKKKGIEHVQAVLERYKTRTQATQLRHKIEKVVDGFRKALLHPTESNYIPAGIASAIIDVYDAVDPTGKKQDSQKAEKYRTAREALRDLKLAYDDLKNETDIDFQTEYDADLANEIVELAKALGNRPLRALNGSELEDVYKIVHDIAYMLRDAKKQILTDEKITNYDAGMEIIENMIEVKNKKLTTNSFSSTLRNAFTNPMRAVLEMVGFDRNARLYKLFDAFDQGRIRANRFIMEAKKAFDALRSSKADRKAFNEAVEQKVDFGFKDREGNPIMITKMQAMQAIMTFEREKANPNHEHLSTSVMFIDSALDAKGKYSEAKKNAVEVFVDAQAVERMKNKLSKWDLKYMEAARLFFGETAQRAINEVMLATRHRIVATEKYYIPYTVNQDYVTREIEGVKTDASIQGAGILKALRKNAPTQLIMRGLNAVIDQHIADVAKIYGFAIPIRNFNKAYNMRTEDGTNSVKNAISRTWDDKTRTTIIEKLVKDLQTNRAGDKSDVLNFIKTAFVQSTLASNISVVIKQAASYPTAASVLSGRSLASGLIRYISKARQLKSLYEEIDAHTPEHYMRRAGMDGMQEIGEANQTKGWMNRVNQKLGKFSPLNWIQAVDVATTAALWEATKAEVEGMGVKKGTDEYWNQVSTLYNKVLGETQPMYDALHRAEITKNNSGLKQLIMFQTQPLQNSGILRVGAMEYKVAKKKFGANSVEAREAGARFRSAIVSQLASHFTFTAMTLLAAALLHRMNPWRDDDGEISLASILEAFGLKLGESFTGAVLPVIGSYGIAIGEKIVGTNKFDVVSDPIVDKINQTINLFSKLKNPSPENFGNMALEVASYFGVPATNMKNIIQGAVLHVQDIANGEPLSFEAGYERTNSQSINIITKAYVNGDLDKAEEMIERLESQGKEESEIMSDVKSNIGKKYIAGDIDSDMVYDLLKQHLGMKQNDIYWALDKWDYKAGGGEDYAKYGDFYKAVETGVDLRNSINRYLKNGVTKQTLATNITNYFKEKYINASPTERQRLKGYLLNAYSVLGYDRNKKSKDIDKWLVKK